MEETLVEAETKSLHRQPRSPVESMLSIGRRKREKREG